MVIIAYWIYITCLVFLTGNNVFSLFRQITSKPLISHNIVLIFFSGLFSLLFFSSGTHLFFPVNEIVHIVVLCLNIIAAIIFRDSTNTFFRLLVQEVKSIPVSGIILIVIVVISWALLSMDQPFHNWDEGRYHLQSLLWTKEYKIIPGLANLHERFGTNSAWYPFCALFDVYWFDHKVYHVLNSYIILLVIVWGIRSTFRKSIRMTDIAAICVSAYVLIDFTFIRQWYIIGVTPDTPLQIIVMTAAIPIIGMMFSEGSFRIHFYHVTTIISAAIMLRVGGFIMLPFALIFFYFIGKKSGFKALIIPAIMISLALLLTITRNYILSGYVLYPVVSVSFLQPDWMFPYGKEVGYWVTNHLLFRELGMQSYGGTFDPARLADVGSLFIKHNIMQFGKLSGFSLLFVCSISITFFSGARRRLLFVIHSLLLVLVVLIYIQSGGVFRFIAGYIYMADSLLIVFLFGFSDKNILKRMAGWIGLIVIISLFIFNIFISGHFYIQFRRSFQSVSEGLFQVQSVPVSPSAPHKLQNINIHISQFVDYRLQRKDIWQHDYIADCEVTEFVPFQSYQTCQEQNVFVAVMNWMNPLPSVGGVYPGLTLRGNDITSGFRLSEKTTEQRK